jgi:hypothetical protein
MFVARKLTDNVPISSLLCCSDEAGSMRFVVAGVTAALLLAVIALQGDAERERVPAVDRVFWVKLTFGLDGKPVPWDGNVTIEQGKILESAAWSFEQRDRFDPVSHKWFCTTVVLTGRSASSFAEPQRGVLLRVERKGETRLNVKTRQGSFALRLNELHAGRPQMFLDGRASAERLGSSSLLPELARDNGIDADDDFPTLAIDARGKRWLAWVGFEPAKLRDHLQVLNLDNQRAETVTIPTARELVDPQLQIDTSGNPWLFWSAPEGENWDLWSSKRTPAGWTAARRLTTAAGSDFHLSTARGPNGEIWLAWQAFRDGNSDILVRRLDDGHWSPEIAVAKTQANEWEPSISIDPAGTAWVGYDSYINGNYDVFLTSIRMDDQGRAEVASPIGIATSADFEAHAAVEAGKTGIVWVACDAAGPNWGKDFIRGKTEFKGKYGETLHASRRLILRAVVEGKLMQPKVPVPQKLTKIHPEKIQHSDTDEMKRFYELPHLTRDGAGRLWLFFRMNRQSYAGHPKMGANWEFYATTYNDGVWLDPPLLLPLSKGRQNQHVSTAIGPGGRIHVAYSTGDHHVDLPQTVRIGKMPAMTSLAADPPLVPATRVTPRATYEPLVRSWKMEAKGETYEVYFGDLHRHTDISLCFPTADGCLVDAYRYALDAVRNDFLAVTDHTRDTDPFPWWRTQKANDLFYVKGVFAPIYGYERSNGIVGGGHRNVFFLERDWPVLRGDAHYSYTKDPRPDNNNPDVALYPKLRGRKAFTAAHTPGYSKTAQKGTWTYHDPQVEPLAEIIQTFRRDYERPGLPQWRDARVRGSLAEEASLWYALARGYKLGFIASSDHHATHTSFACVWAKGPQREEIFAGLRARRTYAATDKIILDVRMGDAVMGEEIDAPEVPELQIRVRGTAPIQELQVIRNRKVIHRSSPNSRDVETVVRDTEYSGGAAYYYVRIRQTDNNMAWGSPIWVK